MGWRYTVESNSLVRRHPSSGAKEMSVVCPCDSTERSLARSATLTCWTWFAVVENGTMSGCYISCHHSQQRCLGCAAWADHGGQVESEMDRDVLAESHQVKAGSKPPQNCERRDK